jgi:hypothetical protein
VIVTDAEGCRQFADLVATGYSGRGEYHYPGITEDGDVRMSSPG